MRNINKIIIHCADTPAGRYFDVDDIRRWHIHRGFSDIGYHFVILLDGTIQLGRPLHKVGAHTRGHNLDSIGICYIGGKNFDTRTHEQKESLILLIKTVKRMFNNPKVHGHRDFANKLCPSFDAKEEYKDTF